MLDQLTRDVEYAAGSMYITGRTIIFDGVDNHGPVTIAVTVDEGTVASDIASVVAGLARLAADHAELTELLAQHGPRDLGHTATPPGHRPGSSAVLVPLQPTPTIPFHLLCTPADRAADQLSQLPAPTGREAIEYRDTPVAHHGGRYVAPGRRVVSGTWRYASPEVCADDRSTGVWIGPPDRTEEQVLVCVSCGLDGT